MALLKSCLCCSLFQGSVVAAIYTTMIYLAAFIMELSLVLEGENHVNSGESRGSLPVPGYVLVILHLAVLVISLLLVHSLYQRRVIVLLAWVFTMVLLFFPELGLILFMVVFHWEITSTYGLLETIFYLFRAAVNILCILCVHSLYTEWKVEKSTERSLKKLTDIQKNSQNGDATSVISYKNHGFLGSRESLSQYSSFTNPNYPSSPSPSPSFVPPHGATALPPLRMHPSNSSLRSLQSMATLQRRLSSASQLSSYYQYPSLTHASFAPQSQKGGTNTVDPFLSNIRSSTSEFNASIYPSLVPYPNASRSEYNLLSRSGLVGPNGTMPHRLTPYPFQMLPQALLEQQLPPQRGVGADGVSTRSEYSTQSLDRRRYCGRPRRLLFEPLYPSPSPFPHMAPLPYHFSYPLRGPHGSRSSLGSMGADSDDFMRYRDVAL